MYFKTGKLTAPNPDGVRGSSDDDQRLSQSISRTRSTVYELALCNKFEFFCTFTQNPELRDRFDLDAFRRDFTQFIRDENKKRPEGQKIKYLLIPEQHKDGAWHMHGLLSGLSDRDLTVNGNGHKDWTGYRSRFGFFSCDDIQDYRRCCGYITKYITKDLLQHRRSRNQHLFFVSAHLQRRQAVTLRDSSRPLSTEFDFQNDYVGVKWFDHDSDEVLEYQ